MWGKVILGLGLLFLGMTTMSDVMQPLRGSAPVRDFFTTFSTSPVLAIIAGTLVTVVVQSSSATVGLTMTLAGSGLIGLQGAIFLVLGDNIGTTITAQLAAIGSGRSARQTAMAHTLFNLIGAIYFALLLMDNNGPYMRLVRASSSDPMRQVANAHSIFNIFNCILFIPFIPALARLCRLIVPPSPEEESHRGVVTLDTNLLETPTLALDMLDREIAKMARFSGRGLVKAAEHFLKGEHQAKAILAMEDCVDEMQRDMTVYVSKLFNTGLSSEQSLTLPVILHTINDIERVSDHAENMVEARERVSGNILETKGALTQAAGMAFETVRDMVDQVVIALESHDLRAAQKVLILEGRMNQIELDARANYSESLATYGIANMTGLAMLDFINYCERAGDHMKNIAQSIIGGGIWHGQEPGE
jgi:phosphate:Na+ symporter